MKPRPSGVEMQNNSDKLLEMSVAVGEDVTLPCEVESIPPPIITWAKDKQLISPFSPRYQFCLCLCVSSQISGRTFQGICEKYTNTWDLIYKEISRISTYNNFLIVTIHNL